MPQGEVRIIGGQWRGRKLKVPDLPGLRPTPNRVRETLFNWLMPFIQGAHCLDLFAGSGVLGFEALSRGAIHVVMVDQSRKVQQLLQEELTLFKAENAEIYCANVPSGLKKPARLFDIVFLDPPYQENLLLPTCFFLEENHFLASEAYIYLESATNLQQNDLPAGWEIIKSKKAGHVAYHLVRRYYAGT
jgi:16S rRNA (guanine966-N2)-methyltransferase